MKRIAVMALALAMVLCMFGCGLSRDTESSHPESEPSFNFQCPDGYSEIYIGDIATYIPEEWKEVDLSRENMREYLLPKFPDDRDVSIFFMRHDDGLDISNFARDDFKRALAERTEKTHPDSDGQLDIFDLEETDEGLFVQPYSYITGESIERGFCLYYGDYWYCIDYTKAHGIEIDNYEVEEPIALMQVYVHLRS